MVTEVDVESFEKVRPVGRRHPVNKCSYNPCKWPYKWVAGVITPLKSVLNQTRFDSYSILHQVPFRKQNLLLNGMAIL